MRWRPKIKLMHVVGLAILVLAWGIRHWDPAPVQSLRLATFDQFHRMLPREPQPTPVPIVLLDIDEESLQRVGQWPWSRATLARLIDRLADYQALVIGFDILFPEYDRLSPGLVASELEGLDPATVAQLQSLPSNEERLAKAMGRMLVVLGQAGVPEQIQVRDGLGRKATFAELGPDPKPYMYQFPGVVRNVPELEAVAAGIGMIVVPPEVDQVIRRLPLVVTVGEDIYPALGLEMLRVLSGKPTVLVKTDEKLQQRLVRIHTVPAIETDVNFRVWPYFRRSLEDLYVSAADVLDGSVPPERLRGAMVVFGTSALGLHDIKQTPMGPGTPGFEVHAQFLETVLTENFLTRPPWLEAAEGTALVVLGLLMVIFVPLLGATYTLLLGAVLSGGMFGASWYAFSEHHLLADPLYASLTGLLLYITLSYLSYRGEEAQRQQIRNAFGRFLAPAMVEALATDPSRLKLGGEMKELTLMFADIRGFTSLAEDFDPEGLTELINRFLTPMTGIIMASGGTIDKYIGDCVMAFWNAPLDDDTHVAHGCASALAMLAACRELNRERAGEDEADGRLHKPIRIGIGINTDEVCVGNMGSDQRFDYSVLGDGVNLASRLEGQCKTYRVDVVIGERTQAQLNNMATLELDLIVVKGRAQPERIYTLIGDDSVAESNGFMALLEQHDAMLAAYRSQAWDDCESRLSRCRELGDGWAMENYYDLIAERIDDFRTEPPGEDWDGVYVATSK